MTITFRNFLESGSGRASISVRKFDCNGTKTRARSRVRASYYIFTARCKVVMWLNTLKVVIHVTRYVIRYDTGDYDSQHDRVHTKMFAIRLLPPSPEPPRRQSFAHLYTLARAKIPRSWWSGVGRYIGTFLSANIFCTGSVGGDGSVPRAEKERESRVFVNSGERTSFPSWPSFSRVLPYLGQSGKSLL